MADRRHKLINAPATSVYYKRTAVEIAATIFPTDYYKIPGDVSRYGAVGDGATNDYTAIQNALSLSHPTIFENKTYRCDTALTWNISRGVIYANNAKITTAVDNIGLTIGALGGSNSLEAPLIYGNLTLQNTGTSTKQGIILAQVRQASFSISSIGWERGIELQGSTQGTQYNNIYIGIISACNYGVYFNPSSTGWTNENNFFGGRFANSASSKQWHIYMADTGSTFGQPNNNKFYGVSLENPTGGTQVGFYYDGGVGNLLDNARIENNGTVSNVEIFISSDAITSKVMFPYLTWQGDEAGAPPITDEGQESIILTQDKFKIWQRAQGQATEMIEMTRDRGNNEGKAMALFRDLYQDSQSSMGVKVDLARILSSGYFYRGDQAGDIRKVSGVLYECILSHTSSSTDEPGVGANWETYWVRLYGGVTATSTAWATATAYVQSSQKFIVDDAGNVTALKYLPGVVTFASSDATPTVANGQVFLTTGTTAITDFDSGVLGQTIRIKATGNITITHNAAIIALAGAANYAMTAEDTLTLTMYVDQVWTEDARSVN